MVDDCAQWPDSQGEMDAIDFFFFFVAACSNRLPCAFQTLPALPSGCSHGATRGPSTWHLGLRLMPRTSQRTSITALCHNQAIDDNEESNQDKETNNHAGESEPSSQTA